MKEAILYTLRRFTTFQATQVRSEAPVAAATRDGLADVVLKIPLLSRSSNRYSR